MISIVYVNYKTASLVIDSIKSVKENTTGVDYEIIWLLIKRKVIVSCF